MARTITSASNPAVSALQTNTVLRNTYMLLAMTLGFAAVTAFISMKSGIRLPILATLGIYFALLFATQKFQNSGLGLVMVFLFTGFLGFTIGPMLQYYMTSIPNGGQLVMLAMGGTAVIFCGLSAYALVTGTNFGFMGGMLMTGILVAFVAALANIFLQIPALALTISCLFIVLSSGLILWQTSEIIHGGETNYISATITLFVSIFNIFTSLLHILGIFGGDD